VALSALRSSGHLGVGNLVLSHTEGGHHQPETANLIEVALRRCLIRAEAVADLAAADAPNVCHPHKPLREVLIVPTLHLHKAGVRTIHRDAHRTDTRWACNDG